MDAVEKLLRDAGGWFGRISRMKRGERRAKQGDESDENAVGA